MGESIEISSPPGPHTLFIMIDFKKSNAIEFDLGANETAKIECQPGGPFLMALVDLFRSSRYIKLHRVG